LECAFKGGDVWLHGLRGRLRLGGERLAVWGRRWALSGEATLLAQG
jgi:hypothetical protein